MLPDSPPLQQVLSKGPSRVRLWLERAVERLCRISSKPQLLGRPQPQLIPDNLVLFDFRTT